MDVQNTNKLEEEKPIHKILRKISLSSQKEKIEKIIPKVQSSLEFVTLTLPDGR